MTSGRSLPMSSWVILAPARPPNSSVKQSHAINLPSGSRLETSSPLMWRSALNGETRCCSSMAWTKCEQAARTGEGRWTRSADNSTYLAAPTFASVVEPSTGWAPVTSKPWKQSRLVGRSRSCSSTRSATPQPANWWPRSSPTSNLGNSSRKLSVMVSPPCWATLSCWRCWPRPSPAAGAGRVASEKPSNGPADGSPPNGMRNTSPRPAQAPRASMRSWPRPVSFVLPHCSPARRVGA